MIAEKIKKASLIEGLTLTFKNANCEDAEFIYSLRSNTAKSQHLSKISNKLEDQIEWLKKYECADDQAYFIICYQAKKIGTIRIYDQQQDSFCWGSWILANGSPRQAAIESYLMLYEFCINILNFSCAHFDVRKENDKVWKLHERLGAKRIRESAEDYFYEIKKDVVIKSLISLRKFLPNGIAVTF